MCYAFNAITDPAKASLYTAWKRALAEREEHLRAARARKHELLRDLKARHETQVRECAFTHEHTSRIFIRHAGAR